MQWRRWVMKSHIEFLMLLLLLLLLLPPLRGTCLRVEAPERRLRMLRLGGSCSCSGGGRRPRLLLLLLLRAQPRSRAPLALQGLLQRGVLLLQRRGACLGALGLPLSFVQVNLRMRL
jgi:hypothetical protein